MPKRIPIDKLELLPPKELREMLLRQLLCNPPNITYIKDLIQCMPLDAKLGDHGILQTATIFSTIDIMKILIEEGIDINSKDYRGRTALHYASEGLATTHGNKIKMLLEAGASTDIIDNKGSTPWDLALNQIRTNFPELNPHYND